MNGRHWAFLGVAASVACLATLALATVTGRSSAQGPDRVALKPGSAPLPPNAAQTATVLLIDVSGSMGTDWRGGVKLESAKEAATDVINMIEQESRIGATSHQVAVVTFATSAELGLAMTTDYDVARRVVQGLVPQQNTDIGAGLQVANEALAPASAAAQRVIILLSDGQSNEGLSPQEILDGPVQDAASAGTCIYTVGFGDPGDLDEDLLRNIASKAGCGQYTYASAPDELEQVYIRLRHQSLGQILGEFRGQVAQGQQITAGQLEVPAGQDQLYVSLHWPGSVLGLVMADPKGRVVDSNYPGASISAYPQLVYAIIDDPLAGSWQIGVLGQDVPQGSTSFDVVASSRVAVTTRTGGVGPALVFLFAIVGGVALLVLFVNRTRKGIAASPALVASGTRLVVRSGRLAGRAFPIGPQGLTIGRARGNTIRLEGRAISAQHAVIRGAQGRFFLQDQGTAYGTYVNGQRVEASPLSDGDIILIGDVELEFRSQP